MRRLIALCALLFFLAEPAQAMRPLQAFNENIPFSTAQGYFPKSLPNVIACWDLQQSTLGKTGSTINTISDACGSAGNLVTTAGPTYNATGLNGLPTAQFNGTSQFMDNTSAMPTT